MNVVGDAVYEHVFFRAQHLIAVAPDDGATIYESIEAGRHHPVWVAFTRSAYGGFHALGGVMGKKLFLEDFLPIVQNYRAEWFEGARFKLCCDPPPSTDTAMRYTHVNILKEANFEPKWRQNANAPDVRETVIQHNAGLMRRRAGALPAFAINADPTHWLMVSPTVTKQSRHFVDGCETSYVWDKNLVSVGNKKMRQPLSDQWIDGWQRCLENAVLNFSAGLPTQTELDAREREERQRQATTPVMPMGEHGWMGS